MMAKYQMLAWKLCDISGIAKKTIFCDFYVGPDPLSPPLDPLMYVKILDLCKSFS